ncbi:MAG TPA: hypothetical protein VLD65_12740, partial [Anaerolineales bacterium]|nr:hypothetical protein [Anaerolineales bacterium]
MSGRLWHILIAIGVLGIISLVPLNHSAAQNNYLVSLTSPDTSSFPDMTAYLDVHDPTGEFVHDLTTQQVTIQENGVSVPITMLTEQNPGVQFVIAISPGSTFGVRDSSGTSRYEYLLQGILAGTWTTQSSGRDDLSLLTLGGPLLTHSADPVALRSILATYKPDDSNATPGLEALASALQVASDPTPRPGMERAILFITPPQTTDVSLGLQSIQSSAMQQNVHIFVWIVAPPEALELPEIDLLRNLAAQTHATVFTFSHDEPVPDLEGLLDPLRYVYQLGYISHITAAGVQQVAVQVLLDGETITSQPQTINLDLQAPNLVILNPPEAIVRKFADQPTPGTVDKLEDLLPIEQIVNIQVSYPDGYTRSLVRTSLFVDGALASENSSSPFEQFSWDLRPYTQDGSHTLRIEATDSLGMVGQSEEISVKITVPSTTQEVAAVVSHNRLLVIGIAVLISASILALVLIVGGRIRPKPYPGQMRASTFSTDKSRPGRNWEWLHKSRNPARPSIKIGLSLPARGNMSIRGWVERLPWFKPKEA